VKKENYLVTSISNFRVFAQAGAASLSEILRRQFGFRNRPLGVLIVFLALYGGAKRGFGVNDLDVKIRKYTGTRKGFFVELGANDGVMQSNSLLLELLFGWRGVLVEPVESSFQKLLHNRRSGRNSIFRAACVGDAYEKDSVDIVYSNLMSSAVGLESDVADPFAHAESGGVFLPADDPVRLEAVPARTLTSVLDESHAPRNIQLLSLDVEGAELEVLRGLDLTKYRIDWMVVECRSIDIVADYLAHWRYSLRAQLSPHDFLFECSSTE